MRSLFVLLVALGLPLVAVADDYQIAMLEDGTYFTHGDDVRAFTTGAELTKSTVDGIPETCIDDGGHGPCLYGSHPLFKEMHTVAQEDLPEGAVIYTGERMRSLSAPPTVDETKIKRVKEPKVRKDKESGTPVGLIGGAAAAGAVALAAAGGVVANRRKS
jgi:hypothetical protein